MAIGGGWIVWIVFRQPPPPNLNCDDEGVPENFEVSGSDPHGFDRDNDGIGCETEPEPENGGGEEGGAA
jgi:hypothetical protein